MDTLSLPRQIEFVRYRPENFILVENDADGTVLIHAARNNFSERQKGAFIRELAAEGFIPDHLEKIFDSDFSDPSIDVQWVIDQSWMQIYPAVRKSATRAVVTVLLVAVSLCVLLMTAAILRTG